MRSCERPVYAVPAAVRLVLAAALALQIGWHAWRPDPGAEAQPLASAPAASTLRVAALGDEAAFAKLLMLRLLAHDRQPGVSIPFMDLDYARVAGWIDAIIDLDPRADAPLLAAARLYGSAPDPARQRTMFELVHRRFLEEPDRRWPWLAHAAVIAKHRLADPVLALRYARAITDYATGPDVPAWARDMSVLIAEETGELETARVLIGGLLHSGRVGDPREIRFLGARLAEIEARTAGRSVDPGAGRNVRSGAREAPRAGGRTAQAPACPECIGHGRRASVSPVSSPAFPVSSPLPSGPDERRRGHAARNAGAAESGHGAPGHGERSEG